MKKILLGLGTVMTLAMPVTMEISCGAPKRYGGEIREFEKYPSVPLVNVCANMPIYSSEGIMNDLVINHLNRDDVRYTIRYHDENGKKIKEVNYDWEWNMKQEKMQPILDAFLKAMELPLVKIDFSLTDQETPIISDYHWLASTGSCDMHK